MRDPDGRLIICFLQWPKLNLNCFYNVCVTVFALALWSRRTAL